MDWKISTLEYKNWKVYDCFNNLFIDEYGIPYLIYLPLLLMIDPAGIKNLPYPDLLPTAISIAFENYFSIFTTPSDLPYRLPSGDTNTLHVIKKDAPFFGRAKRGYFCRKHDQKDTTKIQGSIAPHALIITRKFIIVMDFTGLS